MVVAIGQNLGASVRVVALLKKLGVQHIYARAIDYVHKNILQAFDIDKIIIPRGTCCPFAGTRDGTGGKNTAFPSRQ